MMNRRSLLSASVALAATTALPADVFADDLTADERRLLARVPAASRAECLAWLRDPSPVVQIFVRYAKRATDAELRWLADRLESHFAGQPMDYAERLTIVTIASRPAGTS